MQPVIQINQLPIFAASDSIKMQEFIAHADVAFEEEIALDYGQDTVSQIVVYNDDFNTFDWVIECFVEILNHSVQQAEQLSILIHYKGKASVKQASLDELRPLKDALVDRGLSAVIESEVV